MALFSSYAQPGVYTNVIIGAAGAPLFGGTYLPVLIGEGVEDQSFPNVELHRGSSSVADDLVVSENLSAQVTGLTNSFDLTYFPVVNGDGSGTVTNDPAKIQVTSGGIPVTVISLNGAEGTFQTQIIPAEGADLKATYFFKKTDTLITNEDLSAQIPQFAMGVLNTNAHFSVTIPGKLGNKVSVQFVAAGTGQGKPDATAVIGAGTDQIVIEIQKTDDSTRTLGDILTLVDAGIVTASSGFLTLTITSGHSGDAATATAAVQFANGAGQESNTVFKLLHAPVVDGTNGGVITNLTSNISVLVNGAAVAVAALDGANGIITLANAVPSNAASFSATYHVNTYQNTADLLPAANVSDVQLVGLGPNRSDFIQNVDFALDTDPQTGASTINWGNSAISKIGKATPGFTAFGPQQIITSLRDEKVFLRQLSGAVNGINTVYTLPDTPTDGSGKAKATDDTSLIAVYVGINAFEAFLNGSVAVARLSGANQQVVLYNPPAVSVGNSQNQKVFATYFRNTIADHQYTVTVATPGPANFGTYTVKDELGRVSPLVKNSAASVAAGGFATTGVVYPNSFADAQAPLGAPDETITLTFNTDGAGSVTPAVQALLAVTENAGTLTFHASTPGAIGNNVQIAIDVSTENDVPVVVAGDLVTIYSNWDGTVHTVAQVAAYFPSAATTSGGVITCVASGTTSAQVSVIKAATHLASGADAVTAPITQSYTVSSSLGANGSSGTGYLDQTYIDAKTGFRVTIVNPADHAAFGVPSIPAGYAFAPADTLTFTVSKSAVRHTGTPGTAPAEANNALAITGITMSVSDDLGCNAGDTAVISTMRLSANNPAVGEFYFVTFTQAKTDADMALTIYTNSADAYAKYGQPSGANRLSLGIQLLTLNGAQIFGAIQVRKQPGLGVASDSDFIAALQQLTVALPGSDQKANVIVPLSTSSAVQSALSRQLTIQSGVRQKGEAIGFIGFDQFQTPQSMRSAARAIKNERVIAIGNPVASISLTDPTTGIAREFSVSGEFMAAAMAGMNANPSNDVATTLTRQQMAGFSRLLIRYDDPTMDQMAADGLTLVVEKSGQFIVRHYKSTRPDNPITSEPTSTTTVDFTRQTFRRDMEQFIGRKFTDSLLSDIKVVANARLRSEVDNNLLKAFANLTVTPDANDPTVVQVAVDIMPIFSLLYINITFTVTTNL
jgi:hypothetical protein